jgi:apolipoprotein N-acyltransferase
MLKVAEQRWRRRPAMKPSTSSSESTAQRPRISATFGLGLLGSVLLWAAFPPINLPWLAWIAPVPWLWLAQRPALAGWRPYVVLWLCGMVHWLLMVEGIRLAHPALYAGWLALSAYLGVYLPVFVGLTRVAIHRMRLPLALAAPVIWVGLELLRGHLITGFSMGLLAHTQAEFPLLIQISDLCGGYSLSFVIMLVAASLAGLLSAQPWFASRSTATPGGVKKHWLPGVVAIGGVAMSLGYGHWRLSQTPPGTSGPTAHVALIQGSLDTVFVELTNERVQEIFDHHRGLTEVAVKQRQKLDLVVWPESAFALPERLLEEPLAAQHGMTADEARDRVGRFAQGFKRVLVDDAQLANSNNDASHAGTNLLVGTSTEIYGPKGSRLYNTALLADRSGEIIGRYYKMHPVMFGEYVPFAEYITWLNKVTPISVGLSVGEGPTVFDVGRLKLTPSICFESSIPHLIRGQLRELARRGTPADVLVNLTNDGWFWGSGMLDLQLRGGVFRAVENRKPLLVAANTGISAYIDGNGVVRKRGPRRQAKAIIAEVQADGRPSPYAVVGDWPAWLCVAVCIVLAVGGLRPMAAKTPKLA